MHFPSQEAINLLEPMTNDPVNYVRQGALIASALIMIQQTEVTCPKVNCNYLYFVCKDLYDLITE